MHRQRARLIGDRLAVGGGNGRLDGSGGLLDSGRRGVGGDGSGTIGLETQLGGALGSWSQSSLSYAFKNGR